MDRSDYPESLPVGRIIDVNSEWWGGAGHAVMAWGILNPNGPTLYMLGIREIEGKHRTFFRWLHMLGGCTTFAAAPVDNLTYQSICEDAESINQHLLARGQPDLFDVIPSFLFAEERTWSLIGNRLLLNGAAAKSDWGRHMAYVRQFDTDFFGRTGAEMREFYDSRMAEAKAAGKEPSEYVKMLELTYRDRPQFSQAVVPTWTSSTITKEVLGEWWQIVDTFDYQAAALATLKVMWNGASTMISGDMKTKLVSWELVEQFQFCYGVGAIIQSSTSASR